MSDISFEHVLSSQYTIFDGLQRSILFTTLCKEARYELSIPTDRLLGNAGAGRLRLGASRW